MSAALSSANTISAATLAERIGSTPRKAAKLLRLLEEDGHAVQSAPDAWSLSPESDARYGWALRELVNPDAISVEFALHRRKRGRSAQ